ncbi:hypothetical protein V2A60_005801 [Cordyceps javanica]
MIGSMATQNNNKSTPLVPSCLGGKERAGASEILHFDESIFVGRKTSKTRRVVLDKPLFEGCSGSWVVDGSFLCGTILSRYEKEPFAHMMAAETLFEGIEKAPFSNLPVSLPKTPEKVSEMDLSTIVKPDEENRFLSYMRELLPATREPGLWPPHAFQGTESFHESTPSGSFRADVYGPSLTAPGCPPFWMI